MRGRLIGLRLVDVPAHGGAAGLTGHGASEFLGLRLGVEGWCSVAWRGSPLFWQVHVLTCLVSPPNSLVW